MDEQAEVERVLLLEPTPNDMPAHTEPWLERAKAQLREHFNCRVGVVPVFDRAVVISN